MNESSNPETSISAVSICRNEEKKIERCLNSVTWADEILVIDAESSDKTQAICLDSNQPWANQIRLLSRAWTGFRDQRNYAIQTACHDWIFVIDADEACSPELAQKLRETLKTPTESLARAYKIRRIEYFLGKEIHYGIWNPSYQDRFFHRKGVTYVNEIHEYPVFKTQPKKIHEPIFHSPDFNPDQFLSKMNQYTSLEARDRVAEGKRTNAFRILFAFPAMFFKNYFYYGAYQDGFHGFVISILEGVSRAVRHVKIWRYSNDLQDSK